MRSGSSELAYFQYLLVSIIHGNQQSQQTVLNEVFQTIAVHVTSPLPCWMILTKDCPSLKLNVIKHGRNSRNFLAHGSLPPIHPIQ